MAVTVTKTSIAQTGMAEASIAETGVAKTMTKTVSVTSISQSGGVVDERCGGRQDSSGSSKDCGVSLTPLSVSGIGSGNKSQMSGFSLSNLGGINGSDERSRVEDRGNQRLGVEGRGNKGLGVEGGGNRQSGVLGTESSSVSDIGNSLELVVGINIRVSTADSGISVADLVLSNKMVAITVVQVSEFILGMVLATNIRISSIRVGSVGKRSSSDRGSSDRGDSERSSSVRSCGIGSIGTCICTGGVCTGIRVGTNQAMVEGYNLLGSISGASENC